MGNANRSANRFFQSTEFIGSFKSIESIPSFNRLDECCFVGRSNVGKSSIINSILKSKNLSKTSNETKLENVGDIYNDSDAKSSSFTNF